MGSYTYNPSGAGSVRPHAVASVAGSVNGVANPTYSYDDNGNMLAGAGRSTSYTAFNMADVITQGTTSIDLDYDEGHARIAQTLTQGSATTTTYLNGFGVSRKVVSGASTTWYDSVVAQGAIVAQKLSGASTTTALCRRRPSGLGVGAHRCKRRGG